MPSRVCASRVLRSSEITILRTCTAQRSVYIKSKKERQWSLEKREGIPFKTEFKFTSPCSTSAHAYVKLLSLPGPRFPHLQNGSNIPHTVVMKLKRDHLGKRTFINLKFLHKHKAIQP